MTRLLALDFDGVVSDSAPEAFVVALRTYAEMQPRSRLAPLAGELAGPAPRLEVARAGEVYRRFLELMPLGNRAEDYAVVLDAIDGERDVPDQAAYDVLRAARDAIWLSLFHERFYQLRHTLAREDPTGWLALMSPYPRFVALLRRRAGDAMLAIATSKDRASVFALLRAYGIDDLFPGDRVLDKEAGRSKTAHLTRLRDDCGLDFADITFVDDKVNHLDAVAPLGVRCALATWGYNGEREERQARDRGHLVCSLEDAEAQLFG